MDEQNSEQPKGAVNIPVDQPAEPATEPTPETPEVPASEFSAGLPADKVAFETSGGHKLELKGYLSGGDMEELQRQILENVVFKVGEDGKAVQTETPDLTGTFLLDRTKKALELLVISVDGSNEDVVTKVRALPAKQYDELVEKINELTGPLTEAPKTG